MKDGKLDGYFFNGGPPVAAITDLATSQGVKIRLVDHADLLPKVAAKYGPLYSATVIKAKTYPGQDNDAQVMAVWNLLVVPEIGDADAEELLVVATHQHLEHLAVAARHLVDCLEIVDLGIVIVGVGCAESRGHRSIGCARTREVTTDPRKGNGRPTEKGTDGRISVLFDVGPSLATCRVERRSRHVASGGPTRTKPAMTKS